MKWDIIALIISLINSVVVLFWIIKTKHTKHTEQKEETTEIHKDEAPPLPALTKTEGLKDKIEQELKEIKQKCQGIEIEVEARQGVYESLKEKHKKLLKVRGML